jgi:hypothetical protein
MLTTPRPKFNTDALPGLDSLDASVPLLLLPVRIQTKFLRNSVDDLARYRKEYPKVQRYAKELLVRIFPDQICVDRHEEQLTASEVAAGQQYWQQALTAPDRAPDTPHSLLAWQVLLSRYGATRAAWIIKCLTPEPDKLQALLTTANAGEAAWTDEFRTQILAALQPADIGASAWERAALAKCLPDQFVVALYRKTEKIAEVQDAYLNELLLKNHSLAYNPTTGVMQVGGTSIAPEATAAHEPLLTQNDYQTLVKDLTAEFLQLVRTKVGTRIARNELPVGLQGGADAPGTDVDEEKGLVGNLAWLANFSRAVEVGMAVVIELKDDDYDRGFDRLVVTGVRTGREGKTEAEELGGLLTGHSYADGLALVPQGTPTNNTGTEGAGYSTADDYDAELSFRNLLQAPLFTSVKQPREAQRDGQRLADALGIDADLLAHTPNAGRTDGQEATIFNRMLWPATFGYFAREMLEPLMDSPKTTAAARRFFEEYVTGRGPVPAFRVGNVPYGVLPTTWFSQWAPPKKELEGFAELSWDVMRRLDVTWTERLNEFVRYSPLFNNKENPFFSPPPSRQDILTVLGHEATSVEFYQRYFIGPTLMDTLARQADKLPPQNPAVSVWASSDANQPSPRPTLPGRYLQYQQKENPLYSNFLALYNPERYRKGDLYEWSYAFDVTYQSGYRKVVHTYADEPKPSPEVVGPIVDRAPISEVNRLQPLLPLTPQQQLNDPELPNYIDWLVASSFDKIRLQDFRQEQKEQEEQAAQSSAQTQARANQQATQVNQPIYQGPIRPPKPFEAPNSLLYHLLRQAVLWRYWEAAEAALLDLEGIVLPRQESELFNILQTQSPTTARWQWLYREVEGKPLHEWLRAASHPAAQELQVYLKTLKLLASWPTARLERLLAEHLDLGNHRLDAWKTGQVLVRLLAQRRERPRETYLGSFGWLEDVCAQDKSLNADTDLRDDPDNLGYIHAPSINHGLTAAVLRQGYKSRQFATNPNDPAANRMAVNLSSERVRRALALMEGVRTGSSLAALLGRDFEEGLFNATPLNSPSYALQAETLRQHFPLADEKADPTGQQRPPAPEQDARQVVNGLALIEANLPTSFNSYAKHGEFPINQSPQAIKDKFWEVVIDQIDELRDTLDALGDLTVGESIHQTILGNVEQGAAVLENVAKGKFPPFPDVIHPFRAGVSLTHRVLVHLPKDLPSKWVDTPLSVLAAAEPALNNWLATFWGDPKNIVFSYEYRIGDTILESGSKNLEALHLHPIDLLLLLTPEALQAGSALEMHLAHVVRSTYVDPSPTALADPYQEGTVTVEYPGALRRMLPLIGRIRQLLAASRPANANDLTGPSSQAPAQVHSATAGIDPNAVATYWLGIETQLRTAGAQVEVEAAALTATTPPTPTAQLAVRNALHAAGAYNIPEAYAATGPTATDLAGAAQAVVTLIKRRLAAAERARQEADVAVRYAEVAKALLGGDFRISIPFTLEANEAAYSAAFDATLDGTLMHHHQQNPSVMDEWLQGLAPVRDTMNHLEKVILLNDLLWDGDTENHPPLALKPTQLSSRTEMSGERWLGAEYPNPYLSPEKEPPSDAVSLVQLIPGKPEDYSGITERRAVWLDEWVELIPRREEDTSLVFHYDQPNTEAPQTLLLAVAPDPDNYPRWEWDAILGTVNESLDFAKKRAVEPANLAFTHLGTLLPTIVAPVAREGVTLSLDFRKLIGQAQFPERPLLPGN